MRAEILAATNQLDQAISELEELLQGLARKCRLAESLGQFLFGGRKAAKGDRYGDSDHFEGCR